MKVIVAGSRTIDEYEVVDAAIRASGFDVTEIVSGCAQGVDRQAIQWAIRNGVTVSRFPADWTKYGKSAGYMRNAEMADYADALVAVWDGVSRGTRDMIRRAHKGNLALYVHNWTPKG